MKRIFIILVITFIVCPLESATIYINTEKNVIVIQASPFDQFNAQNTGYYYGRYGVHSGLGPNTGRSVTEYYQVPRGQGLGAEKIINNSGTGAHGPGTY